MIPVDAKDLGREPLPVRRDGCERRWETLSEAEQLPGSAAQTDRNVDASAAILMSDGFQEYSHGGLAPIGEERQFDRHHLDVAEQVADDAGTLPNVS